MSHINESAKEKALREALEENDGFSSTSKEEMFNESFNQNKGEQIPTSNDGFTSL